MKKYIFGLVLLISGAVFTSYINKPKSTTGTKKPPVNYVFKVDNNTNFDIEIGGAGGASATVPANTTGNIISDTYNSGVGTYVKYQYAITPWQRTFIHWYVDQTGNLNSSMIPDASPHTLGMYVFPTDTITVYVDHHP